MDSITVIYYITHGIMVFCGAGVLYVAIVPAGKPVIPKWRPFFHLYRTRKLKENAGEKADNENVISSIFSEMLIYRE
ncbi:hypothetical protein [Mucilaginibacter polytrichastri]|uniref:hypothetical protein n=1 Tax=Mucilaginibacter polytrichastri TaxID=1302689 RepID=UPI0008DFF367|nr:hypothetical protein [Mucilaginibacter polytrichastri]SFS82254.1 hypothetical protein SAMN04487890_104258 [Mucilaginibacter polytrichastri]